MEVAGVQMNVVPVPGESGVRVENKSQPDRMAASKKTTPIRRKLMLLRT